LQIFTLKLIGTKDYLSLSFDDSENLVIRNYEVEIPELFEQVPAPFEYPSETRKYYTIICIRSVFNKKFFKIDPDDRFILKGK